MANALDLESRNWEFESLFLYNFALLAQLEEASDLKSVQSKFESWVEYI